MQVWLTSDGTTEVCVAAKTKTAAARMMGRSLYSFNQFASDLSPTHGIAVFALAHPECAWSRSNRQSWRGRESEGWTPVKGWQ